MKKFRITLCAICAVFGLAACGSERDTGSVTEEGREETIQTETAEENISESVAEEITEGIEESLPEEDVPEETISEDIIPQQGEEENTGLKDGEVAVTFIGHASVMIESSDGTVIYIDPNYHWDYTAKADYILVTHGHDDHQPIPRVKLKDGGRKIKYSEALHDGIYEVFDFGNVVIEAVAAANANHDINVCVGYLITIDGYTFYHAGDTSMIAQMKILADREIDYAFYPIDGVYNMDAAEATEVANLVGADHNIPIHDLDDNQTGKVDAFTPEGRMVMEKGETIILPAK